MQAVVAYKLAGQIKIKKTPQKDQREKKGLRGVFSPKDSGLLWRLKLLPPSWLLRVGFGDLELVFSLGVLNIAQGRSEE